MNKQELIKRIGQLFAFGSRDYIERNRVLDLVKQLDEPQKVKVPQCVADWYEKHKYALEFNIFDYVYRFDQQAENDFKDWFDDINTKAIQILVNMHQFGYEVEKEKRYLVKLKGVFKGYEYLNFKFGRVWTFSNEEENEEYRTCHTKKELEEAGFGWVFDCPGIEIEEVE